MLRTCSASLLLGFMFMGSPTFALVPDTWERPLPISTLDFQEYGRQRLESVFGAVQVEKTYTMDGWVTLPDGTLGDYAAVVLMAKVHPRYTFLKSQQVGLVLSARGAEDFFLFEGNKWAPMAWEVVVTLNPEASKKDVQSFVKEVAQRFPALEISYLDQISVVTLTASHRSADGYRWLITSAGASQIVEARRYILKDRLVMGAEVSNINFRMPYEFTELTIVTKEVSDINALRSISKKVREEGGVFSTWPDFIPPFGRGPRFVE